jgi:hypothetical protein
MPRDEDEAGANEREDGDEHPNSDEDLVASVSESWNATTIRVPANHSVSTVPGIAQTSPQRRSVGT